MAMPSIPPGSRQRCNLCQVEIQGMAGGKDLVHFSQGAPGSRAKLWARVCQYLRTCEQCSKLHQPGRRPEGGSNQKRLLRRGVRSSISPAPWGAELCMPMEQSLADPAATTLGFGCRRSVNVDHGPPGHTFLHFPCAGGSADEGAVLHCS